MVRGAFIVFEGIDRCGKSTQTAKLVENLEGKCGIPTKLMRFPNRTTAIGQKINEYLTNQTTLDDQGIHLLFSKNRWEFKDNIVEVLNKGTTIIVDRYAFSGVAFSAAKGLDFEWCKVPDTGLPAPDVVIYLDMPVEEATKRGNYGEERYENVQFQRRVKDIYDNKLKGKTWEVVDATRSAEEIQEVVQAIAKKYIEESKDKPIKTLWMDDS